MLIGLLSDAHGNHVALRRAIDELASCIDFYIFAGDSFSDSRFCNETIDALRSVDAVCVAGNHELSFLGPTGTSARAAAAVRADNLDFVTRLPVSRRLNVGGKRIWVTHGSPWPPHDAYLGEGDRRWEQVRDEPTDFVVTGHTHWPFARRVGDVLVVNPGSIGRSDCPALGDDVSFAVLDTASGEVEFRRFRNPALGPHP